MGGRLGNEGAMDARGRWTATPDSSVSEALRGTAWKKCSPWRGACCRAHGQSPQTSRVLRCGLERRGDMRWDEVERAMWVNTGQNRSGTHGGTLFARYVNFEGRYIWFFS